MSSSKGVPPSGSGSRPSDGASISVESPPEASIPNADDYLDMYDLARRCITEAGNWSGTPMGRGLLDIARQIREKASAIEARRAAIVKQSAVHESAVPKADAQPKVSQ